MKLLAKSIKFAVEKHEGQSRKTWSKLPYIVHPLEVMANLAKLGIEEETILCAAVLHDVVEDTPTTIEDVMREFGEDVSYIVKELTYIKVEDEEQDKIGKAKYIESFKTSSIEALIIKLSDRIANIEDALKAGKKKWARNLYKKGEKLWDFADTRCAEVHNQYGSVTADRLFEWFDKKLYKFEKI